MAWRFVLPAWVVGVVLSFALPFVPFMVGLVVCAHWYACVVSKICCGLVGAGRLCGYGVWGVADRAGVGWSMACGGGIG